MKKIKRYERGADYMSEDENRFEVKIERIEDYEFNVTFDKEGMGKLVTDEVGVEEGEPSGPSPSRLLAASTLNCLMSSLLYCLEKKRVETDSLEGKIKGTIERKDKHLRVTKLEALISPDVDEEEKEKLEKCVEIFEDYCTVTGSIREGIDVEVDVEV